MGSCVGVSFVGIKEMINVGLQLHEVVWLNDPFSQRWNGVRQKGLSWMALLFVEAVLGCPA